MYMGLCVHNDSESTCLSTVVMIRDLGFDCVSHLIQ